MFEWLLLFFQIMFINILLSGDNAVVIALASKQLPSVQRRQAVWWGTFGAVGLRLILTVIAVYLLQIPYIQAAGALMLLYIAVKLLADDEGERNIKEASSFGKAIWTIMAADFVMSLDNVLAIAAAARGDLAVIIIGIALSVPIIVWGSTTVTGLMQRFPVLVYAGAAVLGFTAGEMFVNDHRMTEMLLPHFDSIHWLVPAAAAIFVLLAGHFMKLRRLTRSN